MTAEQINKSRDTILRELERMKLTAPPGATIPKETFFTMMDQMVDIILKLSEKLETKTKDQ